MAKSGFVGMRVSPKMAEALSAAAERGGVSISDFVRGAVEDRLADDGKLSEAPGSLNPFSHLAAAARGSLKAQRALVQQCLTLAEQTGDPEHASMLIHDGLIFARLAAAHGELQDQGTVIGLLAVQTQFVGEDSPECAEALARVEQLVGQGGEIGELAANFLPSVAHKCSADVMEATRNFLEKMA